LRSTLCKDSRDIKFVKFGLVDYFILNLQVQDRDRYLYLNLNQFDLGFDRRGLDWVMWRNVIGGYRFSKRNRTGSLDPDLMVRIREREGLTGS
jgi:hypothetical protein